MKGYYYVDIVHRAVGRADWQENIIISTFHHLIK